MNFDTSKIMEMRSGGRREEEWWKYLVDQILRESQIILNPPYENVLHLLSTPFRELSE